jgi:hypothetical protein
MSIRPAHAKVGPTEHVPSAAESPGSYADASFYYVLLRLVRWYSTPSHIHGVRYSSEEDLTVTRRMLIAGLGVTAIGVFLLVLYLFPLIHHTQLAKNHQYIA